MRLKGLIVTGSSGAGKSTIVKELMRRYPDFDQVRSMTTREPRPDDDNKYIYIDSLNFNVYHSKKFFITETTYRGKQYGLTIFAVNEILKAKKIPVLIMSPESVAKMDNKSEYLSFFIDADDSQLDERLKKRDGKDISDSTYQQRSQDRSFSDLPNYILINNKVEDTVEMIYQLWNYYGTGGQIPENIIRLMMNCGMLIIDGDQNNVQGASYDLRLGDEYYYAGEIRRLEANNLFLKIDPYDYAIVSCREQIQLPKDVAAHFGLTVGLFCQGLILSNGQQVDPGFRGTLFCLLFNTSNRVVTIKKNSHYATIEFDKMLNFASRYKGKYQNKKDIIEYIPPNVMQGAINELKNEIEELKIQSKNMQSIYMGVIAVIVAALSILLILK